jgi:hypothetical protein
MNRRSILRLSSGAAAVLLLSAHTPYGQWVVYRKKHLLIGCHKEDPVTYDLAKKVAARFAEHLPAAKSRVARAPSAGRLASLLGTEQMEIAILGPADASAMVRGDGNFKAYGAIALRALMPVDGRILLCRADFPARHGWLVALALIGSELVPKFEPSRDLAIPWHPGSLAFLEGKPEPVFP